LTLKILTNISKRSRRSKVSRATSSQSLVPRILGLLRCSLFMKIRTSNQMRIPLTQRILRIRVRRTSTRNSQLSILNRLGLMTVQREGIALATSLKRCKISINPRMWLD
jgi:hypothetical protein